MIDTYKKDVIHLYVCASPPDGEKQTGIAAVVTRNGDDPDSVLLAVGRKADSASEYGAGLKAILMALEEIPANGTNVELYCVNDAVRLLENHEVFPLLEEKQTAERINKRIRNKDLNVKFHHTDSMIETVQKFAERAYRDGAFRIRYRSEQLNG